MKKALVHAALVVSSAVVLVAHTTSPVWAAAFEYGVGRYVGSELTSCGAANSVGNTFAFGCFEPEGDKLYVNDYESDGQSAGMQWKLTDGSREGLCRNKSGNAHLALCDKDFEESQSIRFRVGRCDGDRGPCDRPSRYHDFTEWETYRVGGQNP